MEIIEYDQKYQEQIIDLILHIQNEEAKINLSLAEQPDLLDIFKSYYQQGGHFYLAVDKGEVVGTIAFMNYGNHNAVLKKFFVKKDWRSKKVGLALYQHLLRKLKAERYQQVLLDTPAVAKASHRFYERAGFKRIEKQAIPFNYVFAERDSYLYLLEL